MGRGSSSFGGGGGGMNPKDIKSVSDMISNRDDYPDAANAFLTVAKDMQDEYGDAGIVEQLQFAEMKGKSKNSTMAYWDYNNNIAINTNYADAASMNAAYARSVADKFRPSNGNKTAMEAVAAHEYGHLLTGSLANRWGMQSMGSPDLYGAANRIINESMMGSGFSSAQALAKSISGYAGKRK